jgi:hypothetical protein
MVSLNYSILQTNNTTKPLELVLCRKRNLTGQKRQNPKIQTGRSYPHTPHDHHASSWYNPQTSWTWNHDVENLLLLSERKQSRDRFSISSEQ